MEIDGAKVRQLREDRGMLAKDLAEKASVSTAYLSKVETGMKSNPSPPVVSRIAHALGVPIVALRR